MTTNKERQAAYRQKAKDNDLYRLNTFISSDAGAALTRLARYEGITKRELLERLLINEDEKVQLNIKSTDSDKALANYFGFDE